MVSQLSSAKGLERVVLIANQKGGVGKSSIVSAIGTMTARPNRRVLIVDADQQANVTTSDLGVTGDRGRALATAFQYGEALEPIRNVRPGLDLISGGQALALIAASAATAANTGTDMGANLVASLSELCMQEDYALVLVDSGPGDALLLDALLGCARYLVVPTKDDDASLAGVELLAARYLRVRKAGALVELLGVVLFDANPRATARNAEVLEAVTELLEGSGARPFEAIIRSDKAAAIDMRARHLSPSELVIAAEEHGRRRLARLRSQNAGDQDRLWSRDPSALANDYQALTKELIGRVVAAEQLLSGQV